MKTVASTAAAIVLALAVPALAQTSSSGSSAARGPSGAKMSQAECTKLWDKLDTSKAGSITQSQAEGVVTNFNSVGKNGKLTRSQFLSACERGQVNASAATGSGSRGLTGTTGTGKTETGTTGQGSTSAGSSSSTGMSGGNSTGSTMSPGSSTGSGSSK